MELEAVARRRTWSESPTGASGSGSRAGEKGAHVVKIESRDDYRRRGMDARPQHPRSI